MTLEACHPARAVAAAGWRVVLGLGVWFAVIAAAAAEPPRLPVSLDRGPTYSELVRALGEPPQAEVRPERLEPKPSPGGTVRGADSGIFGQLIVKGGELVLSYPALGLAVTIDREDRPLADPPVRWISLTAPTVTPDRAGSLPEAGTGGPVRLRTPQGLFIGQPRPEALDLAARHFRSRSSPPGSSAVTFVAEAGGPLAWTRPVYAMSLTFDQGQRLRELRYEFKPGLTRPGQWALAGAAVATVAAVAWALHWLWRHKLGAPSLPVAGAGTTRLVGRSLVGAGGLIGVGSIAALGFAIYVALTPGGNAYGGMGAFFLAMYAMMGLLMAATLSFLGRRIEGSA